MNVKWRGWVVFAAVVLITAGGLVWRHRVTVELKAQVERERQVLHERQRERTAGMESNDATVGSSTEHSGTVDQAQTLADLRAQIQELRIRAAARSQRVPALPIEERTPRLSMLDDMLPTDQWRNAGQASAPAALETALWAAAGGDVEALANLLSIDPVVRTKVNALLMTLPDSLHAEYGTPEKLIALLAVKDVPLGAAKIYDPKITELQGTRLSVVLRDQNNQFRSANLILRQESNGWKITVPPSAVDRYAAKLKGNDPK